MARRPFISRPQPALDVKARARRRLSFRQVWSLTLGAVWLGVVTWCGPVSGAQPLVEGGLDLVVLVDISGSMYGEGAESGKGTDPNRLRWLAVKAILDVLSEEDRIAIIPFNQQAPASSGGVQFFSGQFQALGTDRDRLSEHVKSLIHPAFRRSGVPYSDEGKTAILDALKAAKNPFALTSQQKRERAILLLTDGDETERTAEAKNIKQQGKLGEAYKFLLGEAGESVPIYTIGFGSTGKDLLNVIAVDSGGSHRSFTSARDLVSIFQDLVWSLKPHWLWQIELAAGRTDPGVLPLDSGRVAGILDMGIAVVEDRVGPAPIIDTMPPRTEPEFVWSRPEGEKLVRQVRHGSYDGRDAAYAYYYYDGRAAPADFLGQQFLSRMDDLSLRLQFPGQAAVPSRLRVYFVKRTPNLFEIVSPRRGSRFYRHRPIEVVVAMQDHPIFKPDGFELTARIFHETHGVQGASPSGPECVLEYVPGRGFVGQLSAADLPREGQRLDYYTLSVQVRGLPDANHALRRHTHRLPPRTIVVENAVPLTHAPRPVVLSVGERHVEIAIQPDGFDFPGQLPAIVRVEPPRRLQGAELLPMGCFRMAFDRRELPADGRVTLDRGRAVISLSLNPDQLPPTGSYAPGRIVLREPPATPGSIGIAGGTSEGQYEIEIQLNLVEEKLTLDVAPARLESSPKEPHARGTVVVRSAMPRRTAGAAEDGLTLELGLPRGTPARADPFGPDQLWLERAGTKARRLSGVNRNEPVEIHFVPRTSADVIGVHRYELRASGWGFEEAVGEVLLLVKGAVYFDPDPIELDLSEQHPRASAAAKVTWSFRDREPPARSALTVRLVPPQGFTAREIWLQRPGDAQQVQHLQDIRLGEPLEVHVAPEQRGRLAGDHEGQLFAAGEGFEETRALVRLRIRGPVRLGPGDGLIHLRIAPGDAEAVSEPLNIERLVPIPAGKAISVRLEPWDPGATGAASSFDGQQLWLEPATAPQVAGGSLRLDKVDGPFRIHFRPRPSGQLPSALPYRLRAEGPDIDPVERRVALVVDPPEIVLTPEDPIPVGTQPGKQRAVEYLAELKWLPGSQWEFQPDPPGQILFVRRSSPGSAPVPNSLEVGYTGLSDTITLHTGQTRPLRLTLNVPESAAVGDYQGAVDLKDLRSPKPRVAGQLRMQLALNRLQVHFPVDIPGQTPELTESLSIPQFFGIALRREFRVSTTVQGHDGKPVRLEPGKLGIFPEGDVMRTDEAAGGVRKIPAPCLNKKQQEATDSFVVIQADFEARHNADPDRPYRMVVLLRYDELDLETRLDLNLRFVDPRQLFRSPATAP